MAAVGVHITADFPKPWTEEIVKAADIIVTMGCGDACPIVPGKRYKDWALLTILRHGPFSAEIYVMGILPQPHRLGIGRRIVDHVELTLADDGVEFLQVKTLSETHPDEGYTRKRGPSTPPAASALSRSSPIYEIHNTRPCSWSSPSRGPEADWPPGDNELKVDSRSLAG